MTKWILGFVGLLLIGVIGYTILTSRSTQATETTGITSAPHETTNPGALNPEATTTPNSTGSTGTTGQTGGTKSGYTLADVATHNSAASCWTVINGKVYDVTSWITQHPGGQQAILSLCGKDGSAAFTEQHGTQSRPNSELATFLIGSLAH